MVVTPEELEKEIEKYGKGCLKKIEKCVDEYLKGGYTRKGAVVSIPEKEIREITFLEHESVNAIINMLYSPLGWDIAYRTATYEVDRDGWPSTEEAGYFDFTKKKGKEDDKPQSQTPKKNALEIICRGY